MGRRKSPERLEAERLEREYNEQLDRRVEQIKKFIDDHQITDGSIYDNYRRILGCEEIIGKNEEEIQEWKSKEDGLFIKSAINSRKGNIESERSIRIGKIMDAEDANKKYKLEKGMDAE